jgi:cytoplasmic iron level regulating protein YaaA (DUF328/UPF0246 family)
MRIIISPAKKMTVDTDSLSWKDFPVFLPQTEILLQQLQTMDDAALKKLWNCNDKIASLNIQRLKNMDLRQHLTPAILAYEGLQYQYMAPTVFSEAEYTYIQEHLRILSGFYGLLRPFDGVTPYRLEMQAKLKNPNGNDLYHYWNNLLAETLFHESNYIINLASKEYSLCVSKYLSPEIRFITCVFGEEKNGKVIEKGTMCKMARGEMVRYMAEQQIKDPEHIKQFQRLDYSFDTAKSTEETFVFVRKGAQECSLD